MAELEAIQKDLGTPELTAKRLALVGRGDPSLSTTAVDVLLARDRLSEVQHRALSRYAGYRFRIYGRGVVTSHPPGSAEDEWLKAIQAAYEAADVALKRECGARGRREVRAVAIHDRLPRCFDRPPQPHMETIYAEERERLIGGANALVKHFGLTVRRKAG